MKILNVSQRSSRPGPAAWFTGTVTMEEIVSPPAPATFKAVRVSFAPGARTAWHTHPLGQALHIVSGSGLIQLKGEPAHPLNPGDAVWIEPDELHWHGATVTHPLVHLAIQQANVNGIDVDWLNHVSDAEYDTAHP